jgi:hypothetical protein
MSLLFETPLIAGLRYEQEVIGKDEERVLIERLSHLGLTPFRFHGWIGNRKTQTFGWRYDFDDASFAPADPVPQWLEGRRRFTEHAGDAALSPARWRRFQARHPRGGAAFRLFGFRRSPIRLGA